VNFARDVVESSPPRARALVERRGGLAGDLFSVVRPAPGRVGAIWSLRDPAPALRHTVRLITLAARRDR
jgi:hypothetical protein